MSSTHDRGRPSSAARLSATSTALIAAIFAAGLGAGLGASWLFSSPATPPQVSAEGAPASAAAEPAQDNAATDSCERQTWPYIDEKCRARLAEKRAESRQVRVIPADRSAPPTVATSPAPPAPTRPSEALKPSRETVGQASAPETPASIQTQPQPAPIQAELSASTASNAPEMSTAVNVPPITPQQPLSSIASTQQQPNATNSQPSDARNDIRTAEKDKADRSKRSKRAERQSASDSRTVRMQVQPQDQSRVATVPETPTNTSPIAPQQPMPSTASTKQQADVKSTQPAAARADTRANDQPDRGKRTKRAEPRSTSESQSAGVQVRPQDEMRAATSAPETTVNVPPNTPQQPSSGAANAQPADTGGAQQAATNNESARSNARSTRKSAEIEKGDRSQRSKRADRRRSEGRTARVQTRSQDDEAERGSGPIVRTYQTESGRVTVYQRGPKLQVGDRVEFGEPRGRRRFSSAPPERPSRYADDSPSASPGGLLDFFFGR